VIQDCSRPAVYHHLEMLPTRVQWNIQTIRNCDGRSRDLEEALFTVAHQRNYEEIVEKALKQIVFRSSLTQTLKNIPTAGLYKSVKYSFRKLRKMFRSLRTK